MMKIGITGGIGSGKSVVSELLRCMGYPVFDTDREAKQLMEQSVVIRAKLTEVFGDQVYANGKLNRPYLASLIFHDVAARLQVNAIVHPEVRSCFRNWCEKQHSDIVFFESAILYESDFHHLADAIWVISAPEKVRLKRTVRRDGAAPEQVLARMRSQLAQEEKEARADFVIRNNDQEPLIPQVISALDGLRKTRCVKIDTTHVCGV